MESFRQREVYQNRRVGATLFFCTAKHIPVLYRSMHSNHVNCISSTSIGNKPPPTPETGQQFQTTALDEIMV